LTSGTLEVRSDEEADGEEASSSEAATFTPAERKIRR